MKRRKFIQNSLTLGLGATALGTLSANTLGSIFRKQPVNFSFFKLSLAQWSLHNAIYKGELNPYDFAQKQKNWVLKGLSMSINCIKMLQRQRQKQCVKAIYRTIKCTSKVHGVENSHYD